MIASNTGGPKETVVNNITGYLVEDTTAGFAKAMLKVLTDLNHEERQEMGRLARERVEELFSLERFTMQLESVIDAVLGGRCGKEGVETFRTFCFVIMSIGASMFGVGYLMLDGHVTLMLLAGLVCLISPLLWIGLYRTEQV